MNGTTEHLVPAEEPFLQLENGKLAFTEGKSTGSPTYGDVWPQIISCVIAVSGFMQLGLCIGYSGILIAQLSQDPSIEGFDKNVASWVVSLFAVAHLVGGILLPLLDIIGRKKMVVLSVVPFLVNWLLMYFTKSSLWSVYIARSLAGVGGGLVGGALPVYVSEISHINFRSMMLSLTSFLVAFGMLFGAIIGTFFEWRTACLIFAFTCASTLVLSFFIPESPYWLASFTSCREEDVKKPVQYLNRPEKLFHESWNEILRLRQDREFLEEQQKDQPTPSCMDSMSSMTANIRQRDSYIPLLLLAVLFMLQQASGIYSILFYSVNLFESLGSDLGYGINPYSATIAMNVVRFFVTILATILSNSVGRKQMMLYSCLIMVASCVLVASLMSINGIASVPFEKTEPFFEVASQGNVIYNYVILVGILMYISGAGLGVMIVPWVLPSEVLPTATRAIGNSFAMVLSNFSMFVASKTFPALLDIISLPTLFILYAITSLLLALFYQYLVPETNRKTFEEISRYFNKRRHSSYAL